MGKNYRRISVEYTKMIAHQQPTLLNSHIEAYRVDGFATVKNVFSADDVGRWRAECKRLWSLVDVHSSDKRVHWRDHNGQGRIADRLDPVVDISPKFDALSRDPRLKGIVQDIIGDDTTLFKDKLIMKQAGTMGYELHQDYPYWDFLGIPAEDMIIAVVPIDPWDAECGAIEIFLGLHHERIPGPKDEPLDTDPSLIDMGVGEVIQLEPGDICLFHPLSPHQSGPNTSNHARRTLYYTYVRGEHHSSYKRYYAERPEYETKKQDPGQ